MLKTLPPLWDFVPIPPKATSYRNRRLDADSDECMINSVDESVSVIGTDAFMDFVEQIQEEGVELERQEMGEGVGPPSIPCD